MWLPLSSKWGQTRPADDDPRCHLLSTFNHGDLGHGMHEQFRVFPFIFNSFYQVGTPVCRTCRCQISIILQIKKRQLFWETLKRATNFLGITNLGDFSSQKQGGGRIIQMKICSNSYNSVPLILVILRTILFANHHLQRNGGAQRRPNHVDDQLQQSVLFCLEIVAILRFLLLFYSIFTDLEFVKKFTRPNFRAKEFYTLKTRKLRLFLPAIHSKNASKWVIYSFIHLCVCVNLQNM